MERYLETLFRRKALFIVPILVIPLLTTAFTIFSGSQAVVLASVWVETGQILEGSDSRVDVRNPNVFEVSIMRDRLRTDLFRAEVMRRAGLTEAIQAGVWPQETTVQRQLKKNPLLQKVGRVLGMAAPENPNEAFLVGLEMVFRSIGVSPIGSNLVVIGYTGPEPALGQRLIEEVIKLHQEETLKARIRESEVGIQSLTEELTGLEQELNQATESLLRFEEQFPPPPEGIRRPPEELAELQRLQQSQDISKARYLTTLERLSNLRLRANSSITSADLQRRVIDPPVAGAERASINPRQLVLMGMVGVTLGMLMGISLIVFITWRDEVIRTKSDIERALGTQCNIIEVPLIPSSKKSPHKQTIRCAMGLVPMVEKDG